MISDQFSSHSVKANRTLAIYENRLQQARQQECTEVLENQKLRKLIEDMLNSRANFNSFWSKTVKTVENRRKFLLDMIERSSQAFNEGADVIDSYKKIQSRRAVNHDSQVFEMTKMERQIDANHIMNVFLGLKGQFREMAPLEPREISRRQNFKYEYGTRLNLYNQVIENIKVTMGQADVTKAVEQYFHHENESFQIYQYINEMNHQIECLSNDMYESSIQIVSTQDFYKKKLENYDRRIADLHKKLNTEINQTLSLKNECNRVDSEISEYFGGIMDIMQIIKCDFSLVQTLLGDHKRITVFNLSEFISIFEARLNEVLASVHFDQRESPITIKSVERKQDTTVQTETIITTQQCAECAKGEMGETQFDEKTAVYPLQDEDVIENVCRKIKTTKIDSRMHNLSKCDLPHSGIVASRR